MVQKEIFEGLANAIIVQAVKDYRKAKEILKRYPKHEGAKKVVAEVEEFILSEWYTRLTKFDGARLLKMLKKKG